MSQIQRVERIDPKGQVYVMITCHDGSEIRIMDELLTIPGVTEVKGTIGSYDIVVTIESEAVGSLLDTISMIRKISEVLTTTIVLCESSAFCY